MISEISSMSYKDLQKPRSPTVLGYVLCLRFYSGFDSHSLPPFVRVVARLRSGFRHAAGFRRSSGYRRTRSTLPRRERTHSARTTKKSQANLDIHISFILRLLEFQHTASFVRLSSPTGLQKMSTHPSLHEADKKHFKIGIVDAVFVGMILISVTGLLYAWLH